MEESEVEWALRKEQELAETDAFLREQFRRAIIEKMVRCHIAMGRLCERLAGETWTPQLQDIHRRYVKTYIDVASVLDGSFNFSGDE